MRIHDYALVGDCRSAALVSPDGSVDWLCWPHFGSPPILGALLDPQGGRFRVGPATPAHIERTFLDGTAVLRTRHVTAGGVVESTDLMPIQGAVSNRRALRPEHELLREARCVSGRVEVDIDFEPRARWELAPLQISDRGALGFYATTSEGELLLRSDAPLATRGTGRLGARVALQAGDAVRCSLSLSAEAPAVLRPLETAPAVVEEALGEWRQWLKTVCYYGPYAEQVRRSALVLKLMCYAPSGAVVAAPTTSLPEQPGGALNWDYRFCWLRDASMTIGALYGLGLAAEAESFLTWLLHSTRLTRPKLHVLYDLFGRTPGREQRLLDWAGYEGSRPVRIGNAAANQLQLDVYGEVIQAASQFGKRSNHLDRDSQRALLSFGQFVAERWREPDEGIWEPRSGRAPHTHSRLLCWVALDRLLELHEGGLLPQAPAERWRRERAAIRRELRENSWSARLGSYVATAGGDQLDASLLLLGAFGFESPASARMQATFARVNQELGAGDGLLYRYLPEPGGSEGAFGICSFWAARFLAQGGGTSEQARERFEKVLRYANDVGLYGEEIDPSTGEALGNFPQAFTHIGLINAALAIDARERFEREHGPRTRAAFPPAEAEPTLGAAQQEEEVRE